MAIYIVLWWTTRGGADGLKVVSGSIHECGEYRNSILRVGGNLAPHSHEALIFDWGVATEDEVTSSGSQAATDPKLSTVLEVFRTVGALTMRI